MSEDDQIPEQTEVFEALAYDQYFKLCRRWPGEHLDVRQMTALAHEYLGIPIEKVTWTITVNHGAVDSGTPRKKPERPDTFANHEEFGANSFGDDGQFVRVRRAKIDGRHCPPVCELIGLARKCLPGVENLAYFSIGRPPK